MAYSKEEQETVLTFDSLEGQWYVYSSVPKHIRKLMGLGEMEVLETEDDRPLAIRGTLKEKQVSMKKERVMSDEQRKLAGERLSKTRENLVEKHYKR
jgi:bifunctional DNA-binding transcriptional regulator/antitoxin component of YhaV-PrlF toxin-antitoxin module